MVNTMVDDRNQNMIINIKVVLQDILLRNDYRMWMVNINVTVHVTNVDSNNQKGNT